MQNEGPTLFGAYHKDIHSVKEFKDLVKTTPFPHLNLDKIAEFYLKGVDTNSSEALSKAFTAFYGDLRITCSTYLFAKQFAEYSPKRNVFFYYWTYVSSLVKNKFYSQFLYFILYLHFQESYEELAHTCQRW